jgi:Fe-S-cluster containining protein
VFFTFLDRSLSYDCRSCGAACCRGMGLDLDAAEVVRFARLEPRLAMLLAPAPLAGATLIEPQDGCWMLERDGLCGIEKLSGRAAKPLTCRLFPFNKIFRCGGAVFVDFASLACPLQDARGAGQSWHDLEREVGELALPPERDAPTDLPWIELETRVRDAIAQHLDDADYAEFAAYQEEEVIALARSLPPPSPHSPAVRERASRLRDLLGRWRAVFGAGDARAAARQATLLTGHLRLQLLFKPIEYTTQIQRIPRLLLASAFLIELGHAGRRGGQSLRTASETFTDAAALIGVLSFFDRRARLDSPLDSSRIAPEARPAVDALSAALREPRPLGEGVFDALSPFDPHLRGLAFAALAFADTTLRIG